MEIITSLQNKKIKELNKLKDKKVRDKEDLFLVEGDHLVNEAYKMNQLKEVLCLESFSCNFDVPITYISEEVMKKLSNMKSISNVIGVCKKFKTKGYGNRLVLLDGIQDPGNLGTIIRSSACFNFDTIVLGLNTVDLYNDKVIRSTEGMIFHENIIQCDLEEFLKEIKKNNYTIYTTNVNTGKILNDIDFGEKIAIIIGNEGQGVSDISSYADETLYIPMNKKCESLNASVATSIIMYEVSKKDYE
jgi:TrmH family RNA methyltransferase